MDRGGRRRLAAVYPGPVVLHNRPVFAHRRRGQCAEPQYNKKRHFSVGQPGDKNRIYRRHSIHRHTDADIHAHGHEDRDIHSHRDTNQDAHGHGDSERFPDLYADADNHGQPDPGGKQPDRNPHADIFCDPDRNFNFERHAHRHPDGDIQLYGNAFGHLYRNGNSDADTHGNADLHRHRDSQLHCDAFLYIHGDGNGDIHPHGDADRHRDFDADLYHHAHVYGVTDKNGFMHRHSADLDGHAHADPFVDGHKDRDGHGQPDLHINMHNDRDINSDPQQHPDGDIFGNGDRHAHFYGHAYADLYAVFYSERYADMHNNGNAEHIAYIFGEPDDNRHRDGNPAYAYFHPDVHGNIDPVQHSVVHRYTDRNAVHFSVIHGNRGHCNAHLHSGQ